MPLALSIIVPLTLAVVLGSSGVGKLRTPDDLAGWRALRVPTVLTRAWLVRVHPGGDRPRGRSARTGGGRAPWWPSPRWF